MISLTINDYLFITSISVPLLIFITYGMILLYYGSTNKEKNSQNVVSDYPDVTILIPTYNEEKIIDKRIQNILNYDYPKEKMRVIFIDDSNDSTTQIIIKYVNDHSNIELVRLDQRSGYSKAVLAGLQKVNTDIVVLNEAGSFPLPDTLKKQIQTFNNPEIGAVTGKSVILNTNEKIGTLEALYLKIIDFLRIAESKMDTTIFIKGEATAYRTELVKDIKAVQDTGSIDTSMAFLVRKKGYKTVFNPDVVFEEYAPSDGKGFIKQKMIRAANIMRNLLIFRDMSLNPKYGKFGLISFPFYLSAFFIIPLLIPLSMVLLLIGSYLNWAIYKYLLLLAAVILTVTLLFTRDFLRLLIELEISVLKAIYQIFISKRSHDKIERVESTRRV